MSLVRLSEHVKVKVTHLDHLLHPMWSPGMSSLVFACFPRPRVTGDCNEGCQNSATSLRAGFCQGDPLGEPSPSATPASENVHTLRGHPARYVHFLKLAITYGDLPRLHFHSNGAGFSVSTAVVQATKPAGEGMQHRLIGIWQAQEVHY